MNKRIMKKWVKALKSGKYKQGEGALKNRAGGYCCLGVLTCLYNKEKNARIRLVGESYPPPKVRDWAGLLSVSPKFYSKEFKEQVSLPQINDGGVTSKLENIRAGSFSEIADIIETHWESL